MIVEYDGTDFCGWQLQPGVRTIQGEIEAAIAELCGAPVRVHASGRTDSGVHARAQVVCFRSEMSLSPEVVRRAINAKTGNDLAIRAVDIAAEDFDPRRSARRRTYEYRIWNDRVRSAFWRRYALHVNTPLDIDALRLGAAQLIGRHDFSSFRAAGCDAKTPVRDILVSEFDRKSNGMLVYRVTATAFLRHMVRNIVGTLLEVGRGKRDAAAMGALVAARDRDQAGATAPPQGLCLTAVEYDDW